MEIVFTICLLIVPIISVATAFLCLDNIRKIKQLKSIVRVLANNAQMSNLTSKEIIDGMAESL